MKGLRNPSMVRHLSMALAALSLLFFVRSVRSQTPRHMLVYEGTSYYSVETIDHKATEYVGLVELVEPLGRLDAHREGKNWVLNFATASRNAHLKFRDGKKDVETPAGKMQMPAPFFLIDERGYIPLDAVQQLMPQITGGQAQFNVPARHLYLNGAGTHFSAELKKNPSRLVLGFSAPVAPSIVAEGNTLRVAFKRDPVLSPGNDVQDFKDPVIQSASFALTSVGAEIDIKAATPLVANSSDGGRTLTISAAQPQAATPAEKPATAATAPATNAQQPAASATQTPPATAAAPVHPAFLVVIDAAHGGDDVGASISPKLLEKDIALALSRRLLHELQNRGVSAVMIRNSDLAIAPEQRAQTANTSHAALYVAIHASAAGRGLRIFTSLMPPTPVSNDRRAFIPWDAAQSQHLDASSNASGAIAFECDRKQLHVKALQGAVLPLNHVATAAVAIELAPADGNVASLSSTEYLQSVATAVANGIASLRVAQEDLK